MFVKNRQTRLRLMGARFLIEGEAEGAEGTEEGSEEATEESAEGVETPEADGIASAVYEAKIAALTTENLSLTAALMQAKADNYDLLMSQAASVETETDSDDNSDADIASDDAIFL